MMKIKSFLLAISILIACRSAAQEKYKLKLDVPVFDYPENIKLPYRFPSMNQALELSTDLYELAFWGIDESGDLIFNPGRNASGLKKTGNKIFKYALGLAFSKFGSELPVPLGIWGHEEFHRSVLGTRDVSLKNGNWLFSRWDGTVYGISDETLNMLKLNDNRHLLYSYVAGVQYEILSGEKVTLGDFWFKRTFPKGPLVLYNAYYVWNYFRFSSGPASDSAKVLAPPHEDANPEGRDFTGADLNAWVYDMFNPGVPFTARDPFPGGSGVNRRIGFSDLSSEEKEYLEDQKKLSLLNFLNPAIFLIDRIKISDDFSFNFFTQYSPAYFGNSIALFIPFKVKNTGYLFNIHRYNNHLTSGYGLGLGLTFLRLTNKISSDIRLQLWDQPVSFFDSKKNKGGSLGIRTAYSLTDGISAYVSLSGKTKGWQLGNPYLDDNLSVRTGFSFRLYQD